MQVNGKLVIIGCGVAKRSGVHKAADLYTSGYFRLKLAYARTITDDDSILILSGKYGFTRLDQEIASYDQHISENGAISDFTLKQQARGIKVRGASSLPEQKPTPLFQTEITTRSLVCAHEVHRKMDIIPI